jgi:hypothetical protein
LGTIRSLVGGEGPSYANLLFGEFPATIAPHITFIAFVRLNQRSF